MSKKARFQHVKGIQDEHFSEEKGFILRDTEKENSFRRDSNPDPWVMGRTIYHWAI